MRGANPRRQPGEFAMIRAERDLDAQCRQGKGVSFTSPTGDDTMRVNDDRPAFVHAKHARSASRVLCSCPVETL